MWVACLSYTIWLCKLIIVCLSVQFLKKMAQPYDKAGGSSSKTLLSQEDVEKMSDVNLNEMSYWGFICLLANFQSDGAFLVVHSFLGSCLQRIQLVKLWKNCENVLPIKAEKTHVFKALNFPWSWNFVSVRMFWMDSHKWILFCSLSLLIDDDHLHFDISAFHECFRLTLLQNKCWQTCSPISDRETLGFQFFFFQTVVTRTPSHVIYYFNK